MVSTEGPVWPVKAKPSGVGPLAAYLRIRRDPVEFFTQLLNTAGDLVRFRVLTLPYCLINDPVLVRQALVEHSEQIVIQGGVSRGLAKLIGDGILTNQGEAWRKSRTLLQPLFHQSVLSAHLPAMASLVQESFERWRQGHPSTAVPMHREMLALSYRIACSTLFHHVPAFSEAESFADAIWTLQRDGMDRHLSGGDYLPWLPRPQHLRVNRARRALARLGKVSLDEGRSPPLDEVLSLLFAGTESPVTTLCFALQLLEQHPSWRDRLVAELQDIETPEAMDQHPLLTQVVNESLRLFPAGWAFERYAATNVTLGEERIRRGTRLVFSPFHMHRTPRLWRHPDQFDPSRFSAAQSGPEALPRYAFMPFGAGPRSCIGSRLAMSEMRLVLGMFLRSCRWKIEHKEGEGPLRPEGAFKLRLSRPLHVRCDFPSSRKPPRSRSGFEKAASS